MKISDILLLQSLAFALIALVPTDFDADGLTKRQTNPAISADQQELHLAIDNTAVIYEEVCAPNPLYPILLPFCGGPVEQK